MLIDNTYDMIYVNGFFSKFIFVIQCIKLNYNTINVNYFYSKVCL